MSPRNFTSITYLIKKYKQEDYAARSKESEPISKTEALQMNETVEHEIQDTEVQKHVEVVPDTLKITAELKKTGVQSTAHPKFTGTRIAHLPITEDQLPAGLTQPVDTSFRWLAELARYLWQQTHSTIKATHKNVQTMFGGKRV